jgi:hypothetical protein
VETHAGRATVGAAFFCASGATRPPRFHVTRLVAAECRVAARTRAGMRRPQVDRRGSRRRVQAGKAVRPRPLGGCWSSRHKGTKVRKHLVQNNARTEEDEAEGCRGLWPAAKEFPSGRGVPGLGGGDDGLAVLERTEFPYPFQPFKRPTLSEVAHLRQPDERPCGPGRRGPKNQPQLSRPRRGVTAKAAAYHRPDSRETRPEAAPSTLPGRHHGSVLSGGKRRRYSGYRLSRSAESIPSNVGSCPFRSFLSSGPIPTAAV